MPNVYDENVQAGALHALHRVRDGCYVVAVRSDVRTKRRMEAHNLAQKTCLELESGDNIAVIKQFRCSFPGNG